MPRVLSVPARHPYVAAVLPVGATAPDPAPERPAWAPSPALDPAWLRAHAGEVDLLHLHFGLEHLRPADLAAVLDTAADLGLPVVHTVHDLAHPHLVDQAPYDALLDVLIPHAAALTTLTPSAARAVRDRWGREVLVVPHPPLRIPDPLPPRRPRRADRLVVGLHLKSLRANVAAAETLHALAAVRGPSVPVEVRLSLHEGALGGDHPRAVALRNVLAESAGVGGGAVVVEEHPPWSDQELAGWLRGLDALVLPYAWGTHSGLVELGHDLGVPVVVPDTGCWTEQQPCHVVRWRADGPHPDDLALALDRVAGSPRPAPADPAARTALGERVRQQHARLYRELTAGSRQRVPM